MLGRLYVPYHTYDVRCGPELYKIVLMEVIGHTGG